jgi:hypothetical protein
MVNFLIGCAATWRLTTLFISESGPYDVFGRLRDTVGVIYDEHSQPQGTNEVAKALTCIWCASVWIGGMVALVQGYRFRAAIVRALAYSAGAIMVDRWMNNVS